MPETETVVIDAPKWAFWSQRPTIGLRTAVAMVHNFRGTDNTLRALKTADDGRWTLFEEDLRTARKWLGRHSLLSPARSESVPEDREAQDRCEIVLAHFVDWVRTEKRLSATPPAEFLALQPPVPDSETATRRGKPKARGSDAPPADDVPATQFDARANHGSLALGLLVMYVRHLAVEKQHPPSSLLVGNVKRINISGLAKVMSEFAEQRTDQVAHYADTGHGAKIETLRKHLAEAAALFSNSTTIG